jgi:hypothetical protein
MRRFTPGSIASAKKSETRSNSNNECKRLNEKRKTNVAMNPIQKITIARIIQRGIFSGLFISGVVS